MATLQNGGPGPVAKDLVAFYRGWRELEVKTKGRFSGLWIVINDLADDKTPPRAFGDQKEVAVELDRLEGLAAKTPEFDAELRALTLARLKQSKSYLNQSAGVRASRAEVLSRGLRWETVTDAEIKGLDRAYKDLRGKLIQIGKTTASFLDEFQREGRGSRATAEAIRDVGLKGAAAIQKLWPWLSAVECETETELSQGAWRNIVTTAARGFKLIVNEGPNATYSPALREFLGLHEVAGHMTHFAHWRREERLQAEAPHVLLLAIHGQDAYYAEGVGQFLSEVACQHIYGPDTVQNLEMRRVELMLALRNYNIMRIIEDGRTIDQAVECHLDYLGGDPVVIKGQYTAYVCDPFFCCQALCFYPSLKALKPTLALPPAKLSAFAKELLSLSVGPEAMDALVARYMAEATT